MDSLIGIDQHGSIYHLHPKYPRKQLLHMLGATHAAKMYQDPDAKHIGYIIDGLWITLYELRQWKGGQRG